MLKWLLLSLSFIIVDQLSKNWVISLLEFEQVISIASFCNLVLVYNKGAAFGLFAKASGWQFYVFTILAIGAALTIILLLHKHYREKGFAFALSLILGGAIGNVIDRLTYGHVIDFLDLYYKHYHWPAFNIADSAIFIGAILLALDSFVNKKK